MSDTRTSGKKPAKSDFILTFKKALLNIKALPKYFYTRYIKKPLPVKSKIVFVVSIHKARAKRQTFGMVNNSYVRLLALDNNEKEICRFNLKEIGSTETSVLFAELIRENREWQFKAVGEGKIADLNSILALYQ
jgi:stress response protein SCP2